MSDSVDKSYSASYSVTSSVATPVEIITPEGDDPTSGVNPDFVLVWDSTVKEAITDDAVKRREIFEKNLAQEGLILDLDSESASDRGLNALLIWAPLEVLKRYSEILKVRLPMKPLAEADKCQNTDQNGMLTKKSTISSISENVAEGWADVKKGMSLELDPAIFPKKCRRLTGVYSRDKEYLFDVDESNMYDIFPISMRSRIVQYILKRKPYKEGEELKNDDFAFGYERLIQKRVYEAGYPLHDGTVKTEGSTRKLLLENWARISYCLKYQPLDTLKEYYGVNIALYYAWLGYYTKMLGFASVFGLMSFLYGVFSISKDQFVRDVCNSSSGITMCPVCDNSCPYWHLSDKCSYSKFAHLFDNDFTIAFALLMSVWTACFLEFWKRYSARITYRWDLTSFDVRDFTPRPEYVAELKKIYPSGGSGSDHHHPHHHINNNNPPVEEGAEEKRKYDFELTIPFWKRKLPFSLLSYSTVFLLVVLALATLSGVIMYRLWITYFLSKGRSVDNYYVAWERIAVSFTAAFFNLAFIMAFGMFYERLAIKLTEIEYPRTQAEFDASYTLKIYLLQFVNNYSSIFYVAFFKGVYTGHPHKYHKLFGVLRQEECGISCMPELCIQLVVIMVGKQSKSMIVEAFLPWCRRGLKRFMARIKKATTHVSDVTDPSTGENNLGKKGFCQWLSDYDLLDWGQYLLTDEYLEMVLQYGFVTIFVTAFPLAPLLALINNLLELRMDATKMLKYYRRPIGIRVKDIGVWSNIVDGIAKVAILSNACIIALTSNFIPKFMYRYMLQDRNNPNYGTLNGYLNYSLTAYDTNDLESKPERAILTENEPTCHFASYRHSYASPSKYDFRLEHWQIWLARVVFIIVYENIVAVLMLLLRWTIPDIPGNLLQKMQREQRLVNKLILKHELNRTMKTMTSARSNLRSGRTSISVSQQPEFVQRHNKDRFLTEGSANSKS